MHSKYLGSDLSEHELLKDFVVQALKQQSNIKDVLIPQIIEKTGWNWPMSEQFVKQVQTEYGIEISVFTEQLYLYLGWGIVLVGVGLI
jgi:3'-phosphoadenosine 5'-phosphosulfate sulfotransferase (PAPS reductase)/FAD synthetase